MSRVFDEIAHWVEGLEVIDTHEHLPGFEKLRQKETDVLREYLTHYFNRDLVSAGLHRKDLQKAIDVHLPIMDRWKLVEPYWNHARNTGYARSLDLSAKGLYGFPRIDGDTIEALNSAFLQTLQPGTFHRVLKEKCRIKTSLLNCNCPSEKEFFTNIYVTDYMIYPQTGRDVANLENESGITICSFDDWLQACEMLLERALKEGAAGLKSALAYRRTLRYDRVTRDDAERDFQALFSKRNFPDWIEQAFSVNKAFQDYLMHFILRFANRRNLPFQFHTGIHEGNGNLISNSEPSLLSNLFLEYPDVRFDLFHMGYPYTQVLSALAKTFPNVFIDMCWGHILSPTAAVSALVEWLDAVPANKICAFGGDYCFVDGVYGHLMLAREDVSKALGIKVEDGVFDLDRAKEIAKMLFYDNPANIFRLEL